MITVEGIPVPQLLAALSVPRLQKSRVYIPVHNPGTIGGSPCSAVTGAYGGIDWDSGKVFLSTQHSLSLLSEQEVKAVSESVSRGQSWHAYQDWKKEREAKSALQARVQQLEQLLRERGVDLPPAPPSLAARNRP